MPSRFSSLAINSILAASITLAASSSQAEIKIIGDVSPNSLSDIQTAFHVYIGNNSVGQIEINNGDTLTIKDGFIGYAAGSNGTVTVSGVGSTWTIQNAMTVGQSGYGMLNIFNGATVNINSFFDIGCGTDGGGLIDFGSNGGTLNTGSFMASPGQLKGTGTINTSTIVSDIDLVFDATHGLNQTLQLKSSTQNITINLNMSTVPTYNYFGVGYTGQGTLTIKDALKVTANTSYIGYQAGSHGSATVSGQNSTWTSSFLDVGCFGNGELKVTDGGTVKANNGINIGRFAGSSGKVTVTGPSSKLTTSSTLYVGQGGSGTLNVIHGGSAESSGSIILGYSSGSSGVATVDGQNSLLKSSSSIIVGQNGTGKLTITNGGLAKGAAATINSTSSLTMDVGSGSLLDLGTNGVFTNNGIVKLIATSYAEAGKYYSPIVAKTWSGSGAYQTFGGTWDAAKHQFIATAAESATAGTNVNINLSQKQRILITNPDNQKKVGASFQSSASTITFNAQALTSTQTDDLYTQLDNEAILSGWQFNLSGYATGNPVLLSMQIGLGYKVGDLNVWHYDSINGWQNYTDQLTDLSYDGQYANFTVTGFSGYAITTAVPEPASLLIMLPAALMLTVGRRKK